MALNDDELRYKNVIDTLKGLPEVKAPRNFEADLMRRINSEKFVDEKQSFWQKLFLPSRLIPSAGLAVAAVLLLFVVNINSDETENPLLMEPKIREDIIETKDISDIPLGSEEDAAGRREGVEENSISGNGYEDTDTGEQRSGVYSYRANEFAIDKEGLNFRQVNLSDEEKLRLNELKEHFKTLLKTDGNN